MEDSRLSPKLNFYRLDALCRPRSPPILHGQLHVGGLRCAGGGTLRKPQAAIGKLESIIDMVAGRLRVEKPFSDLVVTMPRGKAAKKPKFKLKAAEGRHVLPLLQEILATCFPVESAHEKLRLHCVEALCCCFAELDNFGTMHCRRTVC